MNPFTTTLGCWLALVAGQTPDRPDRDRDDRNVHRMTIVNGSRESVHYFPRSPGDAESYRDLERAENEALIVGRLQQLRAQYVSDEQHLQPIRRQIQERLYGASHNVTTGQSSTASTFYPTNSMSSFSPISPVGSSDIIPLTSRGSTGKNGGGITPAGFFPNATTPLGTSSNGVSTAVMPGNTLRNESGPAFSNGSSMMFPGVGSGSMMSPGFNNAGNLPNGRFTGNQSDNGFHHGGFFNPFGLGGNPLVGGAFNPFGVGAGINPNFSLYGNTQTATSKQDTTSNYSLANGMGDEGRLKAALVSGMAAQSSADYQKRVAADVHAARLAVNNRHPHVAVTLKDGEKRSGQLVQSNNDWLVIRDGEEEHYVRTADIARMTKRPGSNITAVKFAR